MTKLNRALSRSVALIDLLAESTAGVQTSGDYRHQLPFTFFSVVHEHHCGITKLVEHAFYPSAAALIRPLFESYVRGLWIYRCASDEQIEQFAENDNLGKTMWDLADELGGPAGLGSESLKDFVTDRWGMLCSFTHTGTEQLARMSEDKVITAAYTEPEILEILDLANLFGLAAAMGTHDVAGRAGAESELSGLAQIYLSSAIS